MGSVVYALCTITSFTCAVLLMRRFSANGHRLLLWSGLCFCGLTVNNILLFTDYILLPTQVNLAVPRSITAAASLLVLLVGLILDGD